MRAVLMAGGRGTRLRPYTTLIPKPLVPLGGETSIIELVIRQLRRSGFTHVTVAVNHLAHLIMSYLGDGSRWGLAIDYSLEDAPLGTIGPLKLIRDLPEHFLVMNGDILSDLDYGAFLASHVEGGGELTVAACQREARIDFGVLECDAGGRLVGFREKPEIPFRVSMGVYGFSRAVLDSVPAGEPYGFDRLMLDRLGQGRPVCIWPFSGFWLDIGRPEDYEAANEGYTTILERLGLER